MLTIQDRLAGPQPVPYTEFKNQVANKNVAALFARGNSIQGELRKAAAVPEQQDRTYQQFSTERPTFATDDLLTELTDGGATVRATPLVQPRGFLTNLLIFSPSGASAGVGFAVPVDTVNRVVPQLIATGKYVRPTLRIEIDERLNQLLTERLRTNGVAVLRVAPGSAAETAGLRGARLQDNGAIVPGDIILAVDGTSVDSVAQLLNRLDERRPGDTVRLSIWRDGQELDVPVTLQWRNR